MTELAQLRKEDRISLAQAARSVGVNPSTVWRWTLNGVRGVRLSSFNIGAKRWTTTEEVDRFVAATTAVANGEQPATSARTNRQRQVAIAIAEAELDRAGI